MKLVCTGIALPAGATNFENLLVDPNAARDFDYYGLAFIKSDQQPSSADLNALLEYRDVYADEVAVAAVVLHDAGIAAATASRNERDCRRTFNRGRDTCDKRLNSELRKLERRQATRL